MVLRRDKSLVALGSRLQGKGQVITPDVPIPRTGLEYLDHSLSLFAEQQKAFQEQMHGALRENPMTALMSQMTQKNLEIWEEMQKNFLKAAGMSHSRRKDD